MLLKIMERHRDWAVVIALVGGGQEINSGEAGLAEWGTSLVSATKCWEVWASPEAVYGGPAVAGSRLATGDTLPVQKSSQLHLQVSVRSLRAAASASWVNAVVEGNERRAVQMRVEMEFPVFLTRDLAEARSFLRRQVLGMSRAGLVGSSQAARLRAEGLEPDSAFHGAYPWEHWYLASRDDVRGSSQLEVFATEFEVQGLELDWVGMCWGGDYLWSSSRKEWLIRAFRAGSNRWSEVKHQERRVYRQNAYRVLLTRARQGLVIYVPRGAADDSTRKPEEFDATSNFLVSCGAKPLQDRDSSEPDVAEPEGTLFGSLAEKVEL